MGYIHPLFLHFPPLLMVFFVLPLLPFFSPSLLVSPPSLPSKRLTRHPQWDRDGISRHRNGTLFFLWCYASGMRFFPSSSSPNTPLTHRTSRNHRFLTRPTQELFFVRASVLIRVKGARPLVR